MCYKVYNERSEEPPQEGVEELPEEEGEDPQEEEEERQYHPATFPNNQHNLPTMSK